MNGEQKHDPDTVEGSWDVRQDEASGQVYYWNAITGETSWDPPLHLVAEDLSDSEINPPWTQALDDDGQVYYLNAETMETRWIAPPSAAEHQEDVPTSSDTNVITGRRGKRPSTAEQMDELNRVLSGEDEDEKEMGESPEGKYTGINQEGSQAPTLPSDEVVSIIEEKTTIDAEACPWIMIMHEEDRVPYYYNHITGECLWDPPEEFLRFHHRQEEQHLGDIDETPDAGTEAEHAVLPATLGSASRSVESMMGNDPTDEGITQVITPEFEEKVRQAIATVSNTHVGSSRLVLVQTSTQQQLAPRTGRSTGDGTSARSRPSSACPRSGLDSTRSCTGTSRPSSGGSVGRPQTPSETVTSSRLNPILPKAEVSSITGVEISANVVENGPQNDVAKETVDEPPALYEQVNQDQFSLITEATSDEEEEVAGSGAGVVIDAEIITDVVATSEAEAGGEADKVVAYAEALDNAADSDLEETEDAGVNFQGLVDAIAEADLIIDTEAATAAVLGQKAQNAAMTLQCMVRCFVARQQVKHKREERQNSSPLAAAEILSEILHPEKTIAATIGTCTTSSAMVRESDKEDANVLPRLPAQEALHEEPSLSVTLPLTPFKDEHDNDDQCTVSSSIVDQQPPATSSRCDPLNIVQTLPSAHSIVLSDGNPSDNTLTHKLFPQRDHSSISTRVPSVLDVTKYFPQRHSFISSRLAHSGGITTIGKQVSITRKKVKFGSPSHARRISQQEAVEHEQLLESRRKEEELTQQAQTLEYQRIYMKSRKAFEVEKHRLQDEKRARDNQRQHDIEVEKRVRIQAQRERDVARTRHASASNDADRLVWEHLKTQGRPTEQNVRRFRDALTQALDSAQFPTKMCAERARDLHERIERLHRASWAVDSQLEAVELGLLSELHPLTDRQRPLQAKYAVKLRCCLENMINTVRSWQRVVDEWEFGKQNDSTSKYWSTIKARYAPSSIIASSDESRRQYVLNTWRGAAGGNTLLHQAAWNGWEEHVRLLIEEGADVNLVDSSASHRTPLHEACRAGHVSVVEVLLRSGAQLNAVDVSGDSPLHVACRGGWTRVVRILLMAANGLGEETDPTLEEIFSLRNGKGRLAVDVATLPSLVEELQFYDYQINGVTQQGRQKNGVKQRHLK